MNTFAFTCGRTTSVRSTALVFMRTGEYDVPQNDTVFFTHQRFLQSLSTQQILVHPELKFDVILYGGISKPSHLIGFAMCTFL